MSTAEEEEGQVSYVSEVSSSPKRSVKTCHINYVQKDNGERMEQCDANDASNQEFHFVVKSNSVIGSSKPIVGKFNHNSGIRDTHESEETIKSLDCESVKKDNINDSEERDGNENKVKSLRIVLTPEQLSLLSKEELMEKWIQQDSYINALHSDFEAKLQEANELKRMNLNEERLKSQLAEIQRKEQYHIMRLATKEHEIQELGAQIEELKNLTAGGNSLKQSLLDPAINLLFERMKRDFDSTKAKMEEAQNELAAWKFTPDSNTGKQLMAKCRLLIKENEELGKMISSGRLSKLEGDLALQRNFSDELKKSQSELEEFLQEMDEDTEGMQGTILYLQSQLRQAKEKISHLTNQLSLGGQTTSNNTPASVGEAADYAEGSLSETEPLANEDSLLQHYSDEGRTLLESSDAESTLHNAKPNGELLANNSNININNNHSSNSLLSATSGECGHSSSEGLNAHLLKSYPNGRKKRTQSVFEGNEEEEEEEVGTAGEGVLPHPRPRTPSQNASKRTRIDIGVGEEGAGGVLSDHVIENGLTIK